MAWIMLGVIALVVTAVAANLATAFRDGLQDRLAYGRKLKSSGSRDGNRMLLILLFPITLYLVLGTLLLLLLSVIEMATKKLRDYTGASHVEVIAWHQVSVYLTLLFPLAWPIVALMVGLVFAGAMFSAILTAARRVLDAVLRLVRRIWINIVHALHALLEWIMDWFRLVWEVIVEGTQIIWELVVGTTQLILEQISALIHDVWATINARIHV
jgi:phage-related protein